MFPLLEMEAPIDKDRSRKAQLERGQEVEVGWLPSSLEDIEDALENEDRIALSITAGT